MAKKRSRGPPKLPVKQLTILGEFRSGFIMFQRSVSMLVLLYKTWIMALKKLSTFQQMAGHSARLGEISKWGSGSELLFEEMNQYWVHN
jgi:hypothetical protein